MKTVFNTEMVAHVWAQQTQRYGQTPKPSGANGMYGSGNTSEITRVRFLDTVYYSYREPVARIETTEQGGKALLYTSRTFSVSTSGHVHNARGACDGNIDESLTFEVPSINGHGNQWGGKALPEHGSGNDCILLPVDHAGNFEYLVQQYTDAVERFKGRASIRPEYVPNPHEYGTDEYDTFMREDRSYRSEAETVSRALLKLWAKACDYATAFDLAQRALAPLPMLFATVEEVAAECMEIRAKRAADALARLTPAELARRAKAKAERVRKAEFKESLRYADSAAKLDGWREGLKFSTWELPRPEFAFIRATGVKRDKAGVIVKGTLETSQGASVPLVEAIRIFQFLVCIRERGEPWQPKGLRSVQVGQFRVNSVEADGSFVAGCHKFAWPEIEALAERLGVAMLPCSPIEESE